MKAYQPDKPLVVIGQPLGNYSFFRDVLFQLFGKRFLDLSDRSGTQLASWPSEPNQSDGRWLPQIDCVAGVFDHSTGNCVHRCCPADSQLILLVADPFATAVRSYEKAKTESDAGRFWIGGVQTHVDVYFHSIDEYLEQFPRSIYDHLPSDLTLENYQHQFSQRYVYVGVTENPQQSARNIADAIGRPIKSMPSLPIRDPIRPFPDNLRTRFEHNFPLPSQIYRFATDFATT